MAILKGHVGKGHVRFSLIIGYAAPGVHDSRLLVTAVSDFSEAGSGILRCLRDRGFGDRIQDMFVLSRFVFVCLLVLPMISAAHETAELKVGTSVTPARAEAHASGEAAAADVEAPAAAALTTGELAKSVRPCLVAIYPSGRGGTEAGIGSGFVISEDGLIATNMHVIGEGRDIRVEFPDGASRTVIGIQSWDRDRDLAIVRVAGSGMPFLPLGDSAKAEQGQPVIAMGNPLGFRFSVTEGILSAVREIGGRSMLQLAMPVERGNSGGPLLDREGRVLGIITLKSAVTENLGFAMPVNELKQLMDHPNPVVMKNWLTIGALNPGLWKIPEIGGGDARWSQRAGTIQVKGMGGGFGGRSQCLSVPPVPALPYEISVRVKLDDESGAAGLSFCADGGDVHYGFYPSNGGVRLTKFVGMDVTSWTILSQKVPESLNGSGWNELRVRVEAERILCYLNGVLVVESSDTALRSGAAGLLQFRGTGAVFRDFAVGGDRQSAAADAPPALTAAIAALSSGNPSTAELRATLTGSPEAARRLALREAAVLEKRAGDLRQAAVSAFETGVSNRLAKLLSGPDESAIPLAEAALLLARLDNAEVDPVASLSELDRLTTNLKDSLTEADRASPETLLAALNRWMFQENGFHGPREDFSNPSNSHLNEVIDDREGLPITLAILHMELAQRIGLKVAGIGLPGQFLTQLRIPDHLEGGPYIDLLEGGRLLNRQAASALALETTGTLPEESVWEPAGKRDIILRMLSNLGRRAMEQEDTAALLRCLTAHAAIDPSAPQPRIQRFLLLTRAGRGAEAQPDAEWLLDHRPPGTTESELRGMLEGF